VDLGRSVILIVEDDPDLGNLLQRVVGRAGYGVEMASDGAAGWARVAAGGIDLILLDLILPQMDGLELCRRVRAHAGDSYVPIIMLTGLAARQHAGFAAGADDFVTKPFEMTHLLDRVRVWLGTRQRLQAAHEQLALERGRLKASNRALVQATQAKSAFLATISHELRTPLNSILGFSELLLDDASATLPPAQRQRFLRNIDQSGRHLLNLVNNLLDLSKIEAGHMELRSEGFDVAASLHAVTAGIQPLAEKKALTLVVDADPGVTTVYADEGRFQQVLYNLLSNAVKFTPEGGRVATTARLVGGAVEVIVSDTGIGIALEDQQRIFEAFEQVARTGARRHEGTGLGLALARQLVELQGGALWVESAVGQGSRFGFTVPLESATVQRQDTEGVLD